MSQHEDDGGGPAFPVVTEQYHYGEGRMMPTQVAPGMSLRDYFAAKAMQSLLAQLGCDLDYAAQYAYATADAMLKARAAR